MRQSKRGEKRKTRLARLKELLARLPQEFTGREFPWPQRGIEDLPRLDPVLQELRSAGYIRMQERPGYGDPSYRVSFVEMSPSPDQVKRYGIEFRVGQGGATNWEWKLIRDALERVGFRFSGGSWFLNLHSPTRTPGRYSGARVDRKIFRPLVLALCANPKTRREVARELGIPLRSAIAFLREMEKKGVVCKELTYRIVN